MMMANSVLSLSVVSAQEGVLLEDTPVQSVQAQGPEGSFGLLPKHQRMVSQVLAGSLSYKTPQGVLQQLTLPQAGFLSTDGATVLITC
jgi:F0F1-type ATP synthase epsilon subunit